MEEIILSDEGIKKGDINNIGNRVTNTTEDSMGLEKLDSDCNIYSNNRVNDMEETIGAKDQVEISLDTRIMTVASNDSSLNEVNEKDTSEEKVISFEKNDYTFWDLTYLPHLKEAHKEVFETQIAIVDNALKLSDIRSTVREHRRYILSLEHKVDYGNKGIGKELDDLDCTQHELIAEADKYGWTFQHLVSMDKLLHEFDKFKIKLEELQISDTSAKKLDYDNGYGGYRDY